MLRNYFPIFLSSRTVCNLDTRNPSLAFQPPLFAYTIVNFLRKIYHRFNVNPFSFAKQQFTCLLVLNRQFRSTKCLPSEERVEEIRPVLLHPLPPRTMRRKPPPMKRKQRAMKTWRKRRRKKKQSTNLRSYPRTFHWS